ncbi:hypothetical protein KE621_15475 [Shewanella algae]|nr:hypothetical protein BS332_15465 [Shewanella algae]QXP18381.1 hypothetical protein KE621_15475 [Shewanella algae]
MAEGYRKIIKQGLLGSLAMVCFWQGEAVMAQSEKIQEGPASMVFTKHCVGRFEFELPQEMQLLTSGMVSRSSLSISIIRMIRQKSKG